LDGDVERLAELLLVGFLAGTGVILGLLHRLVGRDDGPLLCRLLLWVRPIVAEVKVVIIVLLCLGLLRRLLFLISSELRIRAASSGFPSSSPSKYKSSSVSRMLARGDEGGGGDSGGGAWHWPSTA
jgi:hypothetical protein